MMVSSLKVCTWPYGHACHTFIMLFASFQGYAMLEQIVSGIHTRLYARAYIVADPTQDR